MGGKCLKITPFTFDINSKSSRLAKTVNIANE
jgi:hypothetical protein